MVLLVDDSLVELMPAGPADVQSVLVYEEGRRIIKSTAVIRYVLDEQNAPALAQQDATDVRIVHRDGEYDVEIGEKSRNEIKKAVRCVADIEAA
jgi:hypothetical protein